MCESTVYILKNGTEEMFFEDVDTLENHNGEITLANIFGETKKINGTVKQFSLIDHKIFVEPCIPKSPQTHHDGERKVKKC